MGAYSRSVSIRSLRGRDSFVLMLLWWWNIVSFDRNLLICLVVVYLLGKRVDESLVAPED